MKEEGKAEAKIGDCAPECHSFMREAIGIAGEKMLAGEGGPFGAVVVRDGKIIARGWNRVTSSLDPTAHAEIDAIRKAAQALGDFWLADCEIYVNCEPCPMCLGAIYWAGINRIYYAAVRSDAAAIGFADDYIYREIARPVSERRIEMVQMLKEEAMPVFAAWQAKEDKVEY